MATENEKSEFGKLKDEIKSETRTRIAQGAVAALIALVLIAVSGWWFVLSPKIDKFIAARAGLPKGAVVAFFSSAKEPSPTDQWKLYEKGIGRMIVGAGHNPNDRDKLKSKVVGDDGGAEKYPLSASETPTGNLLLLNTDLQHLTTNHDPVGSSDVDKFFLFKAVLLV